MIVLIFFLFAIATELENVMQAMNVHSQVASGEDSVLELEVEHVLVFVFVKVFYFVGWSAIVAVVEVIVFAHMKDEFAMDEQIELDLPTFLVD